MEEWYFSDGRPKVCPKCAGDRIAWIRYGNPTIDEKLQKELDEGKIVFGECWTLFGRPLWQCKDCNASICRSDSTWNPDYEEPEIKEYLYVKRKPRKCPKCGSKLVANILYGEPAFNEKLLREIDEGKIVIGGCCITLNGPVWECVECGAEFCKEQPQPAQDDGRDLPF